ncbi:MAG: alpha-D-ribose 1-methylphosphonate 5-triphosphate diphosphatase [Candidatus Aquicultor sp.]|nr:alpha-D-ribose 1-methylphosphonate 5-triphosphate diphosphatase [Candidatus Aquicultor sp.]
MEQNVLIKNGRAVLPDRVMNNCDIMIADGSIISLSAGSSIKVATRTKVIDAGGRYVFPGFIDLHCDAIEKEIEPRPNAFFPIEISLSELEKKLAGQGVTTVFHSISFAEGELGLRSNDMAAKIIEKIQSITARRSLIRNRIHIRFEITDVFASDFIVSLIHRGIVDLLSFMDHTPGRGQFQRAEDYRAYLAKTYRMSCGVIDEIVVRKEQASGGLDAIVGLLAEEAVAHGVTLASHDDDSAGRVQDMLDLGVKISEFPVNLEAAAKAHDVGMWICVGAPNVVRGESQSNNLRAIDAIKRNIAQILCSDYYPSALLHAVFKLTVEGFSLPEAVAMASLNPAKAIGIDDVLGSIEVGKKADLIIVDHQDELPVILTTLVEGYPVYQIDYRGEHINANG